MKLPNLCFNTSWFYPQEVAGLNKRNDQDENAIDEDIDFSRSFLEELRYDRPWISADSATLHDVGQGDHNALQTSEYLEEMYEQFT